MAFVHPLLMFTDLDGTLLDHTTYSWSAAEVALAALKEREIPLIINTSKTLAESLAIQRQLSLDQPIIFENGAGAALPVARWPDPGDELTREGDYWLKSFSSPYADVRKILQSLRRQEQYKFTGFGDMTLDEVRQATGLDEESAERAKQRYFTEPIIWQDSSARRAEFERRLHEQGLTHTRGGRFIHIMGPTDKGRAMTWLADLYAPGARIVALGDSDNDLPMLSHADVGVLVRSPGHKLPALQASEQPPSFWITEEQGPAGWNRAVLEIIEEFACG